MPCRRSSSRSASEILPAAGKGAGAGVDWGSLMSFPLEVSAVPGPDKALGEKEDEDQHGEQRAHGEAGEGDGEGEEEQHLDVEDQEQDRVEVIVSLELDPG